ncbi:MAG: molybdopterin-dependent oxidoreductase [Chloroflexi bacterium]|nr:molybdopterin-dependent oxidoreductase [Chloroflexota bacterium]
MSGPAGIGRRRFLQALAVTGASAVLAACGDSRDQETPPAAEPVTDGAATPQPSAWFKDTTPFIVHDDGKSLEARLENMDGLITPNRFFFVRNNSVSLEVDPDTWRLSIEGDAVSNPRTFTYDDIREFPSRTLVCYLECAGNHRAMFGLVQGRQSSGTQWMTGGVSNGEWVGVPLRDVLTEAGITDDAVSVLLIGLDSESPEEGFRRSLPVAKALHPDTLLAYSLNGEDLPRDHGYPLRALVPGWVGSSNVKWLGRIVVSKERLWTRNNTTSYVLIGDDYAPEGQALGKVATTQVIKSALALPWPANLPAQRHQIHGYAHSPDRPIRRVEWSLDSGATWHEAAVLEPQAQYSWARFAFEWDAQPGEHTVMTRATDVAGNTQPDQIPFNEKGYLFNQPVPHPVSVT